MKVESVTFIAPCSDDFAHWIRLQGFSSENERSQFFQNKTGIKYSVKQFVYQISGKFNKLLNCNSSHNIALCGLNINGEKTCQSFGHHQSPYPNFVKF